MRDSPFLGGVINFFGLIKVVLVLIVIAVLIVIFLGVPLAVDGHSMDPNFQTGEVVLVQRFNFDAHTIRRGDVVAARFPADPNYTRLIKRVVGLPGDTISAANGQISVDGQILNEAAYTPIYGMPPYTEITNITLKDGQYFLSGDNRPGSSDSRLWGPVEASDIEGRVAFIAWPLGKMSYIDHVTY